MFVYFTDGTCINDSEIYGVKAKQEQNRYVVEVTIKPTHTLSTTPDVQFKKKFLMIRTKPINILVIILICRRFSNINTSNNKKAYFPGPIGNKLYALDQLRMLHVIPCIFNGLFCMFPF